MKKEIGNFSKVVDCCLCDGQGEIYIPTYKLKETGKEHIYDRVICCPYCHGTKKNPVL